MFKITLADALKALENEGENYSRLLAKDSGDLGFYRPEQVDDQGPHLRDEIYVVASGHGIFRCGDARTPFAPHDIFFVPRGVEHRFEDFSDEFGVWVIFFGPSS